MDCLHKNLSCLNQYEFFRKYLCHDCGKVWICNCEKELALQFLPHQVSYGTEYGTQLRYAVSGFAQNICPECRGQTEEAHPRAAIWGQKGKVERYYWREIYKSYLEAVRFWLAERNIVVRDIIDFENRFSKQAKHMKKEAKKFWQFRHKTEPKYDMKEPTEAAFLSKITVPVKYLTCEYVQTRKGKQKIGRWVDQKGEPSSAEDVVTEWYEKKGFSVRKCERKLISVLVGTLCNSVIQDPEDSRVRIVMRQSTRDWSFKKRDTPLIQFLLPRDFGSKEYFKRRKEVFDNLLKGLEKEDLNVIFEESLCASKLLRNYLWVDDDEAVELGRVALGIIPNLLVLKCIDWAVRDFWNRQSGWPDLFVFKTNEFKFVEVKTPYDKLSLEQMNWFKWAIKEASIPCEIFRLQKLAKST